MTDLLSKVGGRKFTLTVITMISGTAVAPFFPEAILSPVLVFLAACLSAFVASNWASSREYHKTQIKTGSESPQIKQMIAENKKLLKLLEKELESSNSQETTQAVMRQFSEMNATLIAVGQASGNTLQAVQQLNQKITNLVSLKNS